MRTTINWNQSKIVVRPPLCILNDGLMQNEFH